MEHHHKSLDHALSMENRSAIAQRSTPAPTDNVDNDDDAERSPGFRLLDKINMTRITVSDLKADVAKYTKQVEKNKKKFKNAIPPQFSPRQLYSILTERSTSAPYDYINDDEAERSLRRKKSHLSKIDDDFANQYNLDMAAIANHMVERRKKTTTPAPIDDFVNYDINVDDDDEQLNEENNNNDDNNNNNNNNSMVTVFVKELQEAKKQVSMIQILLDSVINNINDAKKHSSVLERPELLTNIIQNSMRQDLKTLMETIAIASINADVLCNKASDITKLL
ncbi:tubulin-specific chaperone C-like [Aphidius gifuensis]|uniref:tubulin-specific chaperone C-like n=1 Tax=Aphidius gifuensis TaxID=684658 RepID=UPI001CDD3390|nr:tubulin-specific chaperone C-like [Aphidius gifuensis]